MNLWIRSQDKMNLVKVSQVNVDYQNNKQIIANYVGNYQCDYYEFLGTYKSKERALEVLDEIQSKINDIHKDYLMSCMKEKETYEIIAWEDFVYEMPKE